MIKNFAMLASILVSATSFAGANQSIPNWGKVEQVRFVSDQRPVDGPLVEIILEKNIQGTYNAVSQTTSSGFGAPVEVNTEILATNLECGNAFADEIGTLTDVICSHDARPFDGNLVKIIFSIDENGKYSARQVVTTAGFGSAPETTVTDLASDLELSK